MSSEALVQGPNGIFAAWETEGKVKFGHINPKTLKLGIPVTAPGLGANQKHPTLAANGRGEVMMAWTQRT